MIPVAGVVAVAVAGAALAWSAWNYASSLSSAFGDSHGPRESSTTTEETESLILRELGLDDDHILSEPRSNEIVEVDDDSSMIPDHETLPPVDGDAGAASAWDAWNYASSWSSVFVDSHGPRESSMTTEQIKSLQILRDLGWDLGFDDDQMLSVPRYNEIVEVDDVSLMIPDHEPLLPLDGGIIKIVTYNLWGINLMIRPRMKAIDKLIQKHTPDIILLQEVTPMIHEIFQNCSWWDLYECSVPQKKAKRRHICIVLSKLPVMKFYDKRFENTPTEKGLYVANIKTRANKKLVVATCHLKCPTPPEMNSMERVSQANEALSSLRFAPNVILGGDMNWDESSDGPFPLRGKWNDAWSILRSEQDGWTYDTKSNDMLRHKWPVLQKRLDRFICKLKDFEMISIDMIGNEAIPNVTYRWQPVFPSDHYGLMLVIRPKQ